MNSKNPKNGHFPPGVPPPKEVVADMMAQGGQLIQMSKSAEEKMKAELVQRIQPHLNELNQENAAEQSAISLVFGSAIRHHGIDGFTDERFDACLALSLKLARANMSATHTKARELFIEKGVTRVPEQIVRAAARAGIVMPTPECPDPTKPAPDEQPTQEA